MLPGQCLQVRCVSLSMCYYCALLDINKSINYYYGAKLLLFLDISSFFSQLIKKSTGLVSKWTRPVAYLCVVDDYLNPFPWQFLNFLPLPHGHGSLGRGIFSLTMGSRLCSCAAPSRVSCMAARRCASSCSSRFTFCSLYLCWCSTGCASCTGACCIGICPRVRNDAMRLFMSSIIESHSLALSNLKTRRGSFCS